LAKLNIRVIVGIVAAPLVIPLVMAVIWVVLVPHLPVTMVGPQYGWMAAAYRMREGFGIGVFAAIVGYVVTVLGAVPAHLWLVRRGYKRWWMYVTLGACLGIATLSIFAFPQFFGNPVPPLAPLVFLIGLVVACATSTALLFWLIAVRSWAVASREFTEAGPDRQK
jgi:hypothetical protein